MRIYHHQSLMDHIAPPTLTVLLLCALIWLYLPGTTGALYYDDYGNLENLSDVVDWRSALTWSTEGFAGPTGRPLALLTFTPHASDWPNNSQTLLTTNIIIHTFNAFLIGLLSFLLARASTEWKGHRLSYIALITGTLWATMPLLASTSLIAIQRMTLLAATFGTLGLIGFVWTQLRYIERPSLAFFLSFGALTTGTLLGMLAKENAALFPIFALWIAVFFLPGKETIKHWSATRNWALFIVLLLLLAYLSPWYRDWFTVIDHRGWSPWERLQYQSIILWDYVRLAWLPRPTEFSPFHDHIQPVTYSIKTFVAALAWVSIVFFASHIYFHRGQRWPLFAVLWFLTAHLLESTVIGLELKFEHRNYLALYGVVMALVIGAFQCPPNYRRLFIGGLALLIIIQSAILLSVTTLWGQPRLAAELWYQENPGSSRALSHVMAQESKLLHEADFEPNRAPLELQLRTLQLERIDNTLTFCPECIGTHIEGVMASCFLEDHEKRLKRLESAIEAANSDKARTSDLRATIEALFRLREVTIHNSCSPIDANGLRALAHSILENAYFRSVHFRGRLLFLNAALAEDDGDLSARDHWLHRGEMTAPTAVPILQYQVYSALKEDHREDAINAIERRRRLDRDGTQMTDDILVELEREINER